MDGLFHGKRLLKWMTWGAHPYFWKHPGGGFKYFLEFSSRNLGKIPILTCAYFSDGWFNHQHTFDAKKSNMLHLKCHVYHWIFFRQKNNIEMFLEESNF